MSDPAEHSPSGDDPQSDQGEVLEAAAADEWRTPSVDALAAQIRSTRVPRLLAVQLARSVIATATGSPELDLVDDLKREAGLVARTHIAAVVNATGVLLHTNLGRAPLHGEAVAAAAEAARSYSNLEFSLESGRRGGRGEMAHRLLCVLTGAEAALVVHNNAGALLLALSVVAPGGEVVVSRGELIEIGGSYRLPDIMRTAGVRLVEVGTTNATRLADYQAALTAETAALLKVHPSNYTIEGFTASVPVGELAAWARGATGVPVVFDAGSGLLDDRMPWWPGPPPRWLSREPGIAQAIDAGAELVLFSGDKLFGGPQAGIVVGHRQLIDSMAASPLARALRIDGPSLAALTATASLYADGRGGEIPVWSMAAIPYEALERRAESVIRASRIAAHVERGHSTLGAGSAPGGRLPSPMIVVEGDPDTLFTRLLNHDPPVVARRQRHHLVIDLRAVPEHDDPVVADALIAACR